MADLGIIFLRRRYPIHWYQSSYIFVTGSMPVPLFLGHPVYRKGLPCIKKTETNGTTNKIIKISAETFCEENVYTKTNVSMTSEIYKSLLFL